MLKCYYGSTSNAMMVQTFPNATSRPICRPQEVKLDTAAAAAAASHVSTKTCIRFSNQRPAHAQQAVPASEHEVRAHGFRRTATINSICSELKLEFYSINNLSVVFLHLSLTYSTHTHAPQHTHTHLNTHTRTRTPSNTTSFTNHAAAKKYYGGAVSKEAASGMLLSAGMKTGVRTEPLSHRLLFVTSRSRMGG